MGSDKVFNPQPCGRAGGGEEMEERGREEVKLPLGLLDTHSLKLQRCSCCSPAALCEHANMPYIREHKEVRRVTVPKKASDKEPLKFLNPIWIFWMHDEEGMPKIWGRRK
jgi:hypothetical protein